MSTGAESLIIRGDETASRERIAKQIYDPLPVGKNETRLLLLHAGQLGDVLSVTLVVAELRATEFPYNETGMKLASTNQILPYEALSYTWGPPVFNQPIVVNGYDFAITESLSLALRHLRCTTEDQYIWADALCISQYDLTEKSLQIRNMGFIYREAARVVVWLGLSNEIIDTALAFASVWHARNSAGGLAIDVSLTLDLLDDRVELLEPVALGIAGLLSHPWFQRAWVVQEVNLASMHCFRCGSHELGRFLVHRLPNLLAIMVLLSEQHSQQSGTKSLPHIPPGLSRNRSSSRIRQMLARHQQVGTNDIPDSLNENVFRSIRSSYWKSEILHASINLRLLLDIGGHLSNMSGAGSTSDNLSNLLLLASHLQATDDRDRIFALMGLISLPAVYADEYNGNEPCIRIDYNCSTSHVYQQVAKVILLSSRGYDILYRGFKQQHGGSELGLPSWTPDWRSIGDEDMISVVSPGRDYSSLLNLRDLDAQQRWPRLFQWNSPDGVLPVAGYLMGLVTQSGSTTDHESAENSMTRPQCFVTLQHSPLWSAVMKVMLDDLRSEPELCPLIDKFDLHPDNVQSDSRQLDKMRADTLAFLANVQDCSKWAVCAPCQKGDFMVQISGGLLPLVLREAARDTFHYIGYAAIAGDSYTGDMVRYRWIREGQEACVFGNEFFCQTDLLVHVSRFLIRDRQIKEMRFKLA